MTTESNIITIAGIHIQVVRKAIKNLHVGVYPPNGRVRVAAPNAMSNDAVRTAVITKLGWIKRNIAKFENQDRQSQRRYLTGETHYFLGRRYRLRVDNQTGRPGVSIVGNSTLVMKISEDATQAEFEHLLQEWYRHQLKSLIPDILEKWQTVLSVSVRDWRIKRMKTKWGSCNPDARRIWLNLELAKKPEQCIEYIAVHELVHLIERHHSDRFGKIMDKHMPGWRNRQKLLNEAPLAHDTWKY